MIALLVLTIIGTQAPDCSNAITDYDLKQCASLDYEKADRELNAAWREVLTLVRRQDREDIPPEDPRPKGEVTLREAQRAWITYRDAHCTVEGYQARGGSAEILIYLGCMASATAERTKELKALYEDR